MTTLAEPTTTPPTTTSRPVVIGLDTAIGSASSSGTGIASSNGWCESVGYTDKKRPFTKLPHPERLNALIQLAARIRLAIGTPDLVVMETPSLASMGGGAHERAWLWWELYRHLVQHDIPVGLMAPTQRMLYAAGKGNAAKAVVVDAVARRWPDWTTHGDDNQADAVVLMAAGLDWAGHPLADMPKVNRAAIDKAVWPELNEVTR